MKSKRKGMKPSTAALAVVTGGLGIAALSILVPSCGTVADALPDLPPPSSTTTSAAPPPVVPIVRPAPATTAAPRTVETVPVEVVGWSGNGRVLIPAKGQRPPLIAIPADPTKSGTVIVDGAEWRVYRWGATTDPDRLADATTLIPTVVIVSDRFAPNDFVQARSDGER